MKYHTDYTDLAPLYALGSLNAADMHTFQTHLNEDCLPCRSLVAVYENVAALLNWLAQTPPSELTLRRMRRRVQAEI